MVGKNVVQLGQKKRVLVVEEIQSDLNQAGRDIGFRDPVKAAALEKQVDAAEVEWHKWRKKYNATDSGTPEEAEVLQKEREAYDRYRALAQEANLARSGPPINPFMKSWQELAVKRIMRLAAEEGYDAVAWTTGEQQGKRYSNLLREHVETIGWVRNNDGTYALDLFSKNGNHITAPHGEDLSALSPERLRTTIGADLANLITNNPSAAGELTGQDLTIGASGMKGFYDDMLPKMVNKYVKKWGGKVDSFNLQGISEEHGGSKVHAVEITPKMANAVLNNPQSLFGSTFQTVEDWFKSLPKMLQQELRDKLPPPKNWKKLDEEGGYAALGPTLLIARTALGALAGAMAGDEENVVRNALIGAGLGAIATPALLSRIVQVVKGLRGGTQQPAQRTAQAAGQVAQQTPQIKVAFNPTHFQQMYRNLVDAARQGVRHDVDVAREGDLLANYGVISQDSIKAMFPGATLNDAETYALHRVLTESGRQVIDLAANVTDDNSMQEFLKALYTHGLLLDPKRLAVEAEAGRSLRMYGAEAPVDVQGMKEFLNQFSDLMGTVKEGMPPTRLVEMVKQFKTPEQMATFAKSIIKPGLVDAAVNLWVNSLLSGPHTHAANTLGNGATLAWAIGERQIAGLLNGEIHPGEAAAMVKGIFESFGDALRLGWEVARQGDEASAMKEAMQRGESKVEYRPRISFQEAGLTGVPGKALDYVSAFFEGMGGRPLLATDEFFKAIAFRAELRARALREAYNAIAAEGLIGKAARQRIQELQDKYLNDVPPDIQKDAEQFAAYVTFTKNLGPTGQWLADGSANHPAVKLVLPFVRAPINIFKFAGERTPLTLFTKSFWKEMNEGGERADLAFAKLAVGSMVMGTAALWAADGLITGGGPNQRKYKDLTATMREGGWQPYSINVSALTRKVKGQSTDWQKGDQFVSINRVEPLGMLLGMAANYVEIVSNAEKDDGFEELANALLMATVKTMASKTFIKGLSQTALAFAFPDEFLGDTLNKQAVSLVPVIGSSLSRRITQTVDPVVREVETFVDNVMANTPGLSSKLPARLHPISGEPVYREGGVGPDIASPLYTSTYKKDPVLEEIVRNKVNIAPPSGVLFGVQLSTEGKAELQRIITHDVKMGGRNLHDALEHLMNSAVYKNGSTGPDGRRALLIRNLVHAFRQQGELKMLKKYPDLMQSVKDFQRQHADKLKSVAPSDDAVANADVDLSVAGQ